MTIFLISQILDSPHLEGQVLVFISPRNRVAQLFPQELDFEQNSMNPMNKLEVEVSYDRR
jgi:hypothetical protein